MITHVIHFLINVIIFYDTATLIDDKIRKKTHIMSYYILWCMVAYVLVTWSAYKIDIHVYDVH